MNAEDARGDFKLLRKILGSARTIAIVGLSKSWERPSNFAAKYMQSHGYKIIPVNPNYTEVLGEKCYASLRDIPIEIDIVDCFRQVEEIPGILEDALSRWLTLPFVVAMFVLSLTLAPWATAHAIRIRLG